MDALQVRSVVAGGATAAMVIISVYIAANSVSARARRANARLPPGPKRSILFGNLFNFPKKRWFETFSSWKETYGDIVYVNVAGISMVIVNSFEIAEELASNRMGIYSRRPHTIMSSELMSSGYALVLKQPDSEFVEQRKVFRKGVGPLVVAHYDPLVQQQCRSLIKALEGFSGHPYDILALKVGELVNTIAYGESFNATHGQELIKLNIERINLITWVFSKIWMVNFFPILRYIPPWFPGAEFRRIGIRGTEVTQKLRYWPFGQIRAAVEAGTADDSLVSRLLKDSNLSQDMLRDAAAVMFSTANDTTSSAVICVLHCLLRSPEWQERVYREIHEIVGHDRLPRMEDIQNMELLNAVWKESIRWNSPAPLGIPHVNSQDDVWNGYFIPKGSLVHCNIGQARFMLRDPRIWGVDSEQFNPQRFLREYNPNIDKLPDMSSLPFGFGRRICPGRHLAERVGLQMVAAILATYKLEPVKEIPAEVDWLDSTVR
ncbi:hypothetical protein PIIN_05414 [Serendipita indica DSM 11827]|uniref:Cytochrome P450 n=1 Tax=Serendipita indica (strain DSM 11827) TaxID=1109443 RepID=G4TJI0_SERID|nr:hypothetical protein PIIN_05414 [Serendipita indica DSM 11827]